MSPPDPRPLSELLPALLARLVPGATLRAVRPLRPDRAESGATEKGGGYGEPVRVDLLDAGGTPRSLVFHTESPGAFGHERRADRARDLLLAFETFGEIPRHARALDVGFVTADRGALSLVASGEPYLVTEFLEGAPYVDDLRALAARGAATASDVARARALAEYLARLHGERRPAALYRRAARDLIGSGEGIFGVIDAYPDDTPEAPPERLHRIELRAAAWRPRLRAEEARCARIHGDFHPFNVLFDPRGEVAVLDASRGCAGDPADDVTAMAINYLLFAVETGLPWSSGFGGLWSAFFDRYRAESGDEDFLRAAPPFLAWRALVVANPVFYPQLSAAARDALLTLAEGVLGWDSLDPG